ncbi:XRE family transcriptional regulator [Streptomyces sp. NPDC016845]|uniref:XRE family transcriptional regulator n=1 Tax=Streptomyces sp. NPDC016845 TaxID=3364972 RepID=UPI0037B010EF
MSHHPNDGVSNTTSRHEVHMPKVSRKGEGKPLRDAMARAGLSGPELAEATKDVDPTGKGISSATVGRLTGRGKTARTQCELSTAWLVAEALHRRTSAPLQDLFSMPTRSTTTVERSRPDAEEE